MIERKYKCDLCGASCAPEIKDVFLVGLYWTDFPVHGWTTRPVGQVEHHICKTCLKSLRAIDTDKAEEK